MKARYQFRFYPTDQQRKSLAQLFGCVRAAWNDALAFCKGSEKLPGFNALSAMLTQSKKTDDREWLKDVSSVPFLGWPAVVFGWYREWDDLWMSGILIGVFVSEFIHLASDFLADRFGLGK